MVLLTYYLVRFLMICVMTFVWFFFLIMKNYFIIKYNLYFKRVSKKYKFQVQHVKLTCILFPCKIKSTKCASVLERISSFFSLTEVSKFSLFLFSKYYNPLRFNLLERNRLLLHPLAWELNFRVIIFWTTFGA